MSGLEASCRVAVLVAQTAHEGQRDQAGRPYIEHVLRVAGYVDPTDPDVVAAALLHDTLEDTDVTAADLAAAAIPATVIETVLLVTRRAGQTPQDYYTQIRRHQRAREVKLADLADNTDPQRLARLPTAHRTRLARKYAEAYRALGVDPSDGAHRRQRRVPV